MPVPNFAIIQELELNAWPDLMGIYRDGWRLRLAGGFTGRANSLLALRPGLQLSDATLASFEAAYEQHKVRTTVRITEFVHEDVDAQLAARGYQSINASEFRCAAIDGFLLQDGAVEITERPPQHWVNDFGRLNGRSDFKAVTMAAILDRIALPVGYARLVEDGVVRAIGMAVVDRDLMEVQSIAVDATCRRRGFGNRLVGSLLAWGQRNGAEKAILSVAADNMPAIKLYSGLGFQKIGGYHYRVKPAVPSI